MCPLVLLLDHASVPFLASGVPKLGPYHDSSPITICRITYAGPRISQGNNLRSKLHSNGWRLGRRKLASFVPL